MSIKQNQSRKANAIFLKNWVSGNRKQMEDSFCYLFQNWATPKSTPLSIQFILRGDLKCVLAYRKILKTWVHSIKLKWQNFVIQKYLQNQSIQKRVFEGIYKKKLKWITIKHWRRKLKLKLKFFWKGSKLKKLRE
jgi:hypothetical protein